MPACITVIYPNASDATFNMDYYLKTHMPLVEEKWTSYGMKGYKISKFVGTGTGDASPYSVQALLHFDSIDSFKSAAQGPNAQAVLGDIPNFSNKVSSSSFQVLFTNIQQEPVIMIGDVVGSSGSQA